MKCAVCKFEADSQEFGIGKFIIDFNGVSWFSLKYKYLDAFACPQCGVIQCYRKENNNDATSKTNQ